MFWSRSKHFRLFFKFYQSLKFNFESFFGQFSTVKLSFHPSIAETVIEGAKNPPVSFSDATKITCNLQFVYSENTSLYRGTYIWAKPTSLFWKVLMAGRAKMKENVAKRRIWKINRVEKRTFLASFHVAILTKRYQIQADFQRQMWTYEIFWPRCACLYQTATYIVN